MDGSSLGHVAKPAAASQSQLFLVGRTVRSVRHVLLGATALLLSSRSSILVLSHLFSSRSEPCSLKIKFMAGRKQRGRGRCHGYRGRPTGRGGGGRGRGGRGRGRGYGNQDDVVRHETDADFAFDDVQFCTSDPSDDPETSSSA